MQQIPLREAGNASAHDPNTLKHNIHWIHQGGPPCVQGFGKGFINSTKSCPGKSLHE